MSNHPDITAAVHDVLHAGPADTSPRPVHDTECLWCGRTDGDLLLLWHDSGTDRATGHVLCGEPEQYRPIPSCTGLPDSCGAAAGTACQPGCASLASDPEVTR